MITKLVIIRAKKATPEIVADLLAKFGHVKSEAKEVSVLPVVWSDQTDPSHIGYVFTGFMLADIKALCVWEAANPHSTVLELADESDASIALALKTRGLRIHPLVERI